MPMKIKKIKTSDDIVAVINLAYQMHRESNFKDMDFSAQVFAERLAALAASKNCLAIVVKDSETIVGGMLASITQSDFGRDKIAMDRGLFVTPNKRGTIAGKILVEAYTEWAQRLGAKRICIDVKTGVNPERTAGFLEKFGFKTIGNCLIHQE